MEYKLSNGIAVKSHETARSYLQPSNHVVEYIKGFAEVDSILDFGCGKLRYSKKLKNKCHNLVLVDSPQQINRKQTIHGVKTTLNEYVTNNMDNTILHAYNDFIISQSSYDIIFCSNVLSSIPDVKTRDEILNKFKRSLNANGKVIIINQYWNSFYNNIKNRESTIQHEDGYLTIDGLNSKYYGLLDRERISEIVMERSFSIINCWYKEQICFIECF